MTAGLASGLFTVRVSLLSAGQSAWNEYFFVRLRAFLRNTFASMPSISPAEASNRHRENMELVASGKELHHPCRPFTLRRTQVDGHPVCRDHEMFVLRTALPPARPSRAGPCDPIGGGSRSQRSPRSRGCPGPAAIPTLSSVADRDSRPSGCRATGPLRR